MSPSELIKYQVSKWKDGGMDMRWEFLKGLTWDVG